jgi:hypothetical protein
MSNGVAGNGLNYIMEVGSEISMYSTGDLGVELLAMLNCSLCEVN